MAIFIEPTPNPRTLKFLPGQKISNMPLDFVTAPADDILLQEIFDIYGVTGVHIGDMSVAITLQNGSLWEEAKPTVLQTLNDHLVAFDAAKFYRSQADNKQIGRAHV